MILSNSPVEMTQIKHHPVPTRRRCLPLLSLVLAMWQADGPWSQQHRLGGQDLSSGAKLDGLVFSSLKCFAHGRCSKIWFITFSKN